METLAIQWRKSSYSGDQGGECIECAPVGPLAWRKSSYSGDQGGDCIECAPTGPLTWHKSSHSSDQGGECLEVAETPATVAVRDSKNPVGPVLTLHPAAFSAFVSWAAASA
ncbi:DUF397 domain-containing protein [Streptomyces sp. NPDC006610]|jgi:hypothetical protein|uniref:DUF397 domain-containing protein n=1 Tax=Streptomyces sp. NPDC006610 TaxID=3154584 RepID=UPI0033A585F3